MKLPQIPNSKSIMRPEVQTTFYGLNHNISAGDGEIYDMQNMTARNFPLLSTREKRILSETDLINFSGIAAQKAVVCVFRTLDEQTDNEEQTEPASSWKLFYNWIEVPNSSAYIRQAEIEHQFAFLGDKVIIFPEKLIYDPNLVIGETQGHLYGIGRSLSSTEIGFVNGTVYGESAQANGIYVGGENVNLLNYFQPGDAVQIEGCVTHPENNKWAVIRDMTDHYMYFDEYTFTLDPTVTYTPANGSLPGGTLYFKINNSFFTFEFDGPIPLDYFEWLGYDSIDQKYYINLYLGSTVTKREVTPVEGDPTGTELIVNTEYIMPYTETAAEGTSIVLSNEVPDMDYICVNDTRLWGCKGNTIYASKLGDPRNFNVFDGLDTDSWQSETDKGADFTGCISYLGYPIFFKNHSIYKVFGDKPSNFQWSVSSGFGVKSGCHKSLAIANETLFFVAPEGICAYSGSRPSLISAALGVDKRWSDALAGSDGLRYYVSMTDGAARSLYVYDTEHGTWHREDNSEVLDFFYAANALFMVTKITDPPNPTKTQIQYVSGSPPGTGGTTGNAKEVSFDYSVEFADCYTYYKTTLSGSENKKGLLRLQIRCELDAGASMTISVKYDSESSWHEVKTISASAGAVTKQSFNVPLILQRCDHFRLKLSGSVSTGDDGVVVYSITKLRYAGSNLQ